MAVYDVDGNLLTAVYDVEGNALSSAYDVEGNLIYSDNTLRVCTYNVGGWYIGSGTNVPTASDPAFYALQNGMISDINADILCIEEFWTMFSSSRTAASLLSQYYDYIETADGNTTYSGRAICSKYPITSYTQHYFSGETARYYDHAVINFNGTNLNVFVTHLHPSDSTIRIAEATELFNYIQTQGYTNYIVCGDFNSNLHDPMTEVNIAIYKQFLDEGCAIANDGAFGILNTACNSADWSQDAFAIDNIIASDAFTINSVNTNTAKTTNAAVLAANKIDHIPLYAVLEFSQSPEPSVTYETVYSSNSLTVTSNGNGTGYCYIPDLSSVSVADGSEWRITIDGHADECTAEFNSQLNTYGIPYYDANNANTAILFNNGAGWIVYLLTQDSGSISLKVEQAVSD